MHNDAARLRHLLDQLGAEMEQVLRDMAPIVAGYFMSLTQAGMPPREALEIALDAQRQMLASFIRSTGADDGG
jgi:hypothetical protein